MFFFDWFGTAFKVVLLLGTLTALIVAIHAKELYGKNHGEFYLLIIAVCAGGMFLCSASNLLMIYLSLESLSIISYAMAGYLRKDRKSAEAGMKYVIYGAMASGIMIYGMSYLYGLTGTLNLYGHHGVISELSSWSTDKDLKDVSPIGLVAVLAMIFAGFLYKVAAAPFHYWSPDVYEGSPTTAAGFFSVVPKAAGFAALIRVAVAIFPSGSTMVWKLDRSAFETMIMTISVLTMCIGNLAALGQTNVKRMLAYSSIAHAGYLLIGVVAGTSRGITAMLVYLLIYSFMQMGAFAVVVMMRRKDAIGDELKDLSGLAFRQPFAAFAMLIFMLSLGGIPPTAGFMGKFWLFSAAIDQHYYWLAVIGVLNSAISLYYYVRVVVFMYLKKETTGSEPIASPALMFTLALAVAATIILGVYPRMLFEVAEASARTLGAGALTALVR